MNGSLLHQPKFQSRIYSRPAQGVFPGLATAEFQGASLAQVEEAQFCLWENKCKGNYEGPASQVTSNE